MTDSPRNSWAEVFRVGPRQGDHRVAARAAIAVGIPLLVLWSFGRLDLSLYASFGAFAALYGRHEAIGDRLRMQLGAGAVQLGAMLVGTALSFAAVPHLVQITVVAIAASLVTLLAYSVRWHPPGALFAVFAMGATASIPATTESFVHVIAVGGPSVLFALLVTAATALVMQRRMPRIAPSRQRQAIGSVAIEMAVTVGVAAWVAGGTGAFLIGTHWYWSIVAAVAAVSGAQVSARLVRGAQRLIGTLLGIAVAAGILALGLPDPALILLVVALQAGAELFVGRNYGVAMVFVTPLALVMVNLASATGIDVLLRDRAVETVIGVLAGTLIAIGSALIRRRSEQSHPAAEAD